MTNLKTIFALSAITAAVTTAAVPSAHAFNPGLDASTGQVDVAELAASPRTGVSLKNTTKFGAGTPGAMTIHRPQVEDTSVN